MSLTIVKNKLKKYDPEGETEIVIPEGVESIGANVFKECDSIERVVFPDTLVMIGQRAFAKCRSLKDIVLPDSVKSIANYAFFQCENLASIKLPEQMDKIGDSAFSGCTLLQEVSYPKQVGEMGKYVFFNCDGLADENGFVVVNGILYTYCGNAEIIIVPDTVRRIEDKAFESKIVEMTCMGEMRQVRKVQRIILPSSVNYTGDFTFAGCVAEDIVSYGIPVSDFPTPELKLKAFIGYAREYESFDLFPDIVEINSDYIGRYKKNYLPYIYENDFVEGLKIIAGTGKTDLKEFNEVYLIPAQTANAMQCTAFLIEWRHRQE